MNSTEINSLVSTLDFDWFETKKSWLSINQVAENDSLDFIDIKEDDLINYCWNSTTIVYDAESNSSNPKEWFKFSDDGSDVAHKIIKHIDKQISEYIGIKIKNGIIEEATAAMVSSITYLKKGNSDPLYHQILDVFVSKSQELIDKKYRKILEEFEWENKPLDIDRILTVEICSEIANFKLGNKNLVSKVEGTSSAGEALFNILSPYSKLSIYPDVYIGTWTNQAVFFLLFRLNELITGKINFAKVQSTEGLNFRLGGTFNSETFHSWVTGKKSGYVSKHEKEVEEINSQLAAIFIK